MKKLFLLIFLIAPLFIFSQNFVKTWQQCYGGSSDDWVYDIIPYKSGYLFFGHTRSTDGDISYNPGTGTAWLVNINYKGDIIFDTCYEGYSWAYGKKIIPIDTGGYYLLGDSGNNNNEINGYWLAQIDTSFNLIWQDVLGGSYVENFRGGCIAHDGGIIESGITGSPDGDIEEHFGGFDNWLVKMNADGSRDWVKTYGNAGAEEGGEIIPTSDGGYIYACSGFNQLPGNTYCEGHDGMMAEAWLIKLDAQGEVEWHQCYGGSHIDLFKDIIELEDGYIVIGNTESTDGDINNFHGIAGDSYDVWVVRTNISGEIIWSNCYGGSNKDAVGKIIQNVDNTFTIFASTRSHNGDVQGNTAPNNEGVVWMLKIDEDGNLLYQKPFDHEPYLSGGDYVKISDYKYIITSTKRLFGCNYSPGNSNDDIYIFEIQDMDEFIPSQPIGADRVCLGLETETYYSTNLVIDTMETQWLLEPAEAGNIIAMHDSVLINWNMDFHDTAWLKVKSINIYGESSYSLAKEIIVYPALNLTKIMGADTICSASNTQTIFTALNPENHQLTWLIEPEISGSLIALNDTATIIWSPSFEGEVALKTNTVNNCGTLEYSPTKTILVKTCLGIGEQAYRKLKAYPNPAKDYIIFELPQNIKKSELYITDIYGTIITKINIPAQQAQSSAEHCRSIQWNCQNIEAGIYFYQTEIGGVFYRGKVVIE